MPFKTQYGSHYHMTEGCHGATIPCGTEGLTPCSDCCRGAGKAGGDLGGAGKTGGGLGGAGSPATSTLDDEYARAEAELDALMEQVDSPDWDFDEMSDDAVPFGDGGPYSLYGSSDYVPDAPSSAKLEVAVADRVTETGLAGTAQGMGAPSMESPDDITSRLESTNYGVPSSEWDDDTRHVAEVALVPEDAELIGRMGSLYVFETSSISTSNPNDPDDRRGGWLYDVKSAVIVAPDGRNLTQSLQTATNLRKSVEHAREAFEGKCLRLAQSQAREVRFKRRDAAVAKFVSEAREAYRRDVLDPWQDGLDDYISKDRSEHPEHWRYPNMPGDVESRMRREYGREHPKPSPWHYGLPEYQEAQARGTAEADRQLQAEGWSYEEETKSRLSKIREMANPDGTRGVPARMLENYEHAMGTLSRYPEALELVGDSLEWGATRGMPVKLPERWRRRVKTRD